MPPPAVPVPLEPPIRDIDGSDLAPMLPRLIALASDLEVGVRFGDLPGRAHGCYEIKTQRIAIDGELSANQKVKTFCHEFAHAIVRLDRHPEDPELDYASEELVAESLAFTCVRSLGIPAEEYSIPYLTSWAEDTDLEVLEQTAGLIDRLAARIETALHTEPADNDVDDVGEPEAVVV